MHRDPISEDIYGLTLARLTKPLREDNCVGINGIHCHLLLEESKGQGVQRLACQTLVS